MAAAFERRDSSHWKSARTEFASIGSSISIAVHPSDSQRAAKWEKRLKAPVLVAAIAVLPLVALGLSQPTGAWHTVETVGHWTVWLTFVVEVAIMLTVVDDRRAWMSGHKFELLVVVVSSPLVPLAGVSGIAP